MVLLILWPLILLSSLALGQQVDSVQGDWIAPSLPDQSTTIRAGDDFQLQWSPDIVRWFPRFAPSANLTQVRLYVIGTYQAQFIHLVAPFVDLTSQQSIRWTVNVPEDELAQTKYWGFSFVPQNVTYSGAGGEQVSSPMVIIEGSTTNTSSIAPTSTMSSAMQSSTLSSAMQSSTLSSVTQTSTMSSAATGSDVPAPTATTLPAPPAATSRLSGGAIAGVAVGSAAGVALVAVAAWLLWRRRKNRAQSALTRESKDGSIYAHYSSAPPPFVAAEMDGASRPPVELPPSSPHELPGTGVDVKHRI
ncbi:hypothetical protein CAC42_3525 [Sphaceloma murrayae]|uniref:Uncharacterized protein n=1 Tax=Sphaceloma murrayae TaxID=2082308 RepID=A0A2K1R1M4_9PEZI|nr:hypothetical protein CAC42_3525 [Sphaceloma murrayae]